VRIVWLVFALCVCFAPAEARKRKTAQFLYVPVDFAVVNGSYEDSKVYLRKGDRTVGSFDGRRTVTLRLEYNGEYRIDFTKPGFITKSIIINTTVPEKRRKRGFDEYKIGVRLFKQYPGVNVVIFNQPVAVITYQREIDDFGYSTDYTKSILSEIERAEALLDVKAMIERGHPYIGIEDVSDEWPKKVPVEFGETAWILPEWGYGEKDDNGAGREVATRGSEGRGRDWKKREPAFEMETMHSRSFTINSDAPSGEVVVAGSQDNAPITVVVTPEIIKTIEVVKELNRVITITVIQKGIQVRELRKVRYDWGVTYHFLNGNNPISQHLYEYLIQEFVTE
jgi:hypothetical protein